MNKIGQNSNNNTKLFNNCIAVVVQQSSHVQLLCNPTDYSTPDSSVLHYLPKLAQAHVRLVSDVNYLILIKYYYYVTFMELPFLHEFIPHIMLNSLLSDPCNCVFHSFLALP